MQNPFILNGLRRPETMPYPWADDDRGEEASQLSIWERTRHSGSKGVHNMSHRRVSTGCESLRMRRRTARKLDRNAPETCSD